MVEGVASVEWRECDDVAVVMQTQRVGRKSREGVGGVEEQRDSGREWVGGGSEIGAGRSQTHRAKARAGLAAWEV